MPTVRITVDISDLDHELARLQHGPSAADQGRLDAVVVGLFAETQAYVHVATGRLRASGRLADPELDGGRWTGGFRYGNEIADYAAYERDRGVEEQDEKPTHRTISGARHGDHDFLRPAEHRDHAYREPVLDFLRGRP